MKRCNECLEVKSDSEFAKNRAAKDGLYWMCRECKSKKQKQYYMDRKSEHTRRNYVNHYGITPYEVQKKVEAQKGLCAICGMRTKLNVDHHHATGKVRDLLCSNCNSAIGKFNEDIAWLMKAIEYLQSHQTYRVNGSPSWKQSLTLEDVLCYLDASDNLLTVILQGCECRPQSWISKLVNGLTLLWLRQSSTLRP